MNNKFYNAFDTERMDRSSRTEDYRTPFQIDRDRIIHSSEFRRLQGKTQVFLPGEYDFYRTRLTHSIEVAQIGRSICHFLKKKMKNILGDNFFIDPVLVEAICLSHDLGHPPFGHAGERVLNQLLKKYGGFEGNAQTLRLLTEIFYRTDGARRGMNPTRAMMDGVMKYKSVFGTLDDPMNHFIYNEQQKYVDWVFSNRSMDAEFRPGDGADGLKGVNMVKSIECQIMDWADDTAYVINDLVDSISGGFLTIKKLEDFGCINDGSLSAEECGFIKEIIESIKNDRYKRNFGSQIGAFIESVSLREVSSDDKAGFISDLTNRYRYRLKIRDDFKTKAELYKKISYDMVFLSPQLNQMEYKGGYLIKNIFKTLVENYISDPDGQIKLLPDFSDKILRLEENETAKARLLCDYIAGMTDAYAMRTYKQLFLPDYSSFVDFV